jgi:hypothetical protein
VLPGARRLCLPRGTRTFRFMDERTDLRRIGRALVRVFGRHPPVGYLRGKTAMRDALVSELGVSALEAEELIDTLEMRGLIRFDGDPSRRAEADAPWQLHH